MLTKTETAIYDADKTIGFIQTHYHSSVDQYLSANSCSLEWIINHEYELTVIKVSGLRPPAECIDDIRKPYNYLPDERIRTEKLLGKPSLGQSPPIIYKINLS